MNPDWPQQMLTTITFTDAGAGKTTVAVEWTPIDPTPVELATFETGHDSMTQGWSGTFDQLADYLRAARA
jgi:uncharacterized protein YndB with AHSA1/START domain